MTLTIEQTTAIWGEVLAPAHVGPDSDFFVCGGTSLSAARIATLTGRAGGVPVKVRTVLANPSPARLLAALTDPGAVRSAVPTADPSAGPDGSAASAAEPGDDESVLLSSQQEAIWFMECLNPAGRGYNCVTAVRAQTAWNPERLRAALNDVIRNNPVLRTTFPVRGGLPVQTVVDDAEAELRIRGRISPEELREELAALSETRFDVTGLPLIFWVLYEDAATGDSVLAQVEHHFVHDGWSTWLILDQLAQAYRGVLPPARPEHGYRAFAARQRRWLGTDEAAGQRDFWVEHLSGDYDEVRFPGDEARPAAFNHRGTTVAASLDPALAERLATAAGELGVTPFTILYSAFGALMSCVSGARQPIIGTAYRNRAPEYEQTVGMFVNTLGIRFPQWRETSFRELAGQVAGVLADGHDNQEIPLSAVVRELRVRPQLARNPLFQVCMSMNDRPGQRLDFGDFVTYDVDFIAGGAKFDLDVVVVPPNDARTWRLLWRYYAEVLDDESVGGLIRRFEALVSACVDRPDEQVGRLLDGELTAVTGGGHG